MDWSNVTVEELVDAIREAEWSTPPRPLVEFFQKFSAPKTVGKWTSRIKCNLYYYRTNYFMFTCIFFALAFIRNLLPLIAVILSGLANAFLNDSFAISFSEKATRTVRRIFPPLAARMRGPSTRTSVRGRPLKSPSSAVHVCGQDRRVVVALVYAVSLFVWYASSAMYTLLWALAASLAFVALHATFRSPNLKARLNSFREEFRAVWRGYSEAP